MALIKTTSGAYVRAEVDRLFVSEISGVWTLLADAGSEAVTINTYADEATAQAAADTIAAQIGVIPTP